MDQPADPLTRQLALSALTTEHFNLQPARMGTIAEPNGRSTLRRWTRRYARCWTHRSRWPRRPARRARPRFPANLGWRATFAVLLCEAGRPDEARKQLEPLAAGDFAGLPRNHLYLYHLAVLAIACHALDDWPRAARLYELLLPYGDRNVLVARLPLGTLGSASHYLGLLAATTGRWDDAAAHFEAAMRAHERMGAASLLERSRHHHAQALRAKSGKHSDDPAE